MQNLLQLRLLPVAGGLKNPGEGLKPLLVYYQLSISFSRTELYIIVRILKSPFYLFLLNSYLVFTNSQWGSLSSPLHGGVN